MVSTARFYGGNDGSRMGLLGLALHFVHTRPMRFNREQLLTQPTVAFCGYFTVFKADGSKLLTIDYLQL